MSGLEQVHVGTESLERYLPLLGAEQIREARQGGAAVRAHLNSRSIFHVNSTSVGTGAAESLRAQLPYVRGIGINARWLVFRGSAAFFHITKRIHEALNGESGDGSALDDAARMAYEASSRANLEQLLAWVRPRDIVVLHDPQTAGLAPGLVRAGVLVVWRCHIGSDTRNDETSAGWAFLRPYLRDVHAYVFSRSAYVPPELPPGRCVVIPPSIDPFSPKNEPMDDATAHAILAHIGVICGRGGAGHPKFHRADGSPGRVDHCADVIGLGPAPDWGVPLVVQVARWDRLKDPVGVLMGFGHLVDSGAWHGARLVLAGPNVNAIADDPDGVGVFEEVLAAWRHLSHHARATVQLVSLPTADIEENAAIVNALQRHASIVVQKSLCEGFGLAVTEAMWKARPVVVSAVGGLNDQVTDGADGLLVSDPRDIAAFSAALRRLLDAPEFAQQLGERAQARVRANFLGVRHLLQYVTLFQRLDDAPDSKSLAAAPAIPGI